MDKTVAELKDRLNRFTREAAEIEIHLGQAQETIYGAQNLVHKLDMEYSRWQSQVLTLEPETKFNRVGQFAWIGSKIVYSKTSLN